MFTNKLSEKEGFSKCSVTSRYVGFFHETANKKCKTVHFSVPMVMSSIMDDSRDSNQPWWNMPQGCLLHLATLGKFTFQGFWYIVLIQFSSVAQSCPTLCDPMNRSTPDLPVHHQLPEFTQTHVHWVSDAIQPSHCTNLPILNTPYGLSF